MRLLNTVLILFMATPISTYAACEIAGGAYTSFGGSEIFIQLDLNDSHAYKLRHEAWLPGKHEKREEKRLIGQYSCNGEILTLTFGNSTGKARVSKLGENPVSLDPNTKVLEFWIIQGHELEFMSNEILYPSRINAP